LVTPVHADQHYMENFDISFKLRNGDESLSGCHPQRATLGLNTHVHWAEGSGRSLLRIHEDGTIQGTTGESIGQVALRACNEFRIGYRRLADGAVRVSYWLDSEFLGAYEDDAYDYEDQLIWMTFASQEGTAWFDDIVVRKGCAATRDLSNPRPFYCPQQPKLVSLDIDAPDGAQAVAFEDSPPAGWTDIQNISDGGTYDSVNHKVKWGPFFAPFPASVSYEVKAPVEASGERCFMGSVSIDGESEAICGDTCIEASCCPFAPADDARPACFDCADCSCGGGCQDGRVELCEVIGYVCAWQKGCNDDLNGMTRSAFLWVSGECYCWDDAAQNWMSHACESPDSGCCTATPLAYGPVETSSQEITPRAEATITESLPSTSESPNPRTLRARRRDRLVGAIQVAVPTEAVATALEIQVPRGWKVVRTSDEGVWDDVHRKIKWGPYFDGLARKVRFEVQRVSRRASVHGFRGALSVDGIGYPMTVEWSRAKR